MSSRRPWAREHGQAGKHAGHTARGEKYEVLNEVHGYGLGILRSRGRLGVLNSRDMLNQRLMQALMARAGQKCAVTLPMTLRSTGGPADCSRRGRH